MKRAIGTILFVIYSIIAILVTVLLLSFNDYNCSELGGYTVYIVNDDSLEPEYKRGSILLIKGTNDRNVKIGDNLFLYKVINSETFELVNRKLTRKIQQGNHIVYEVEDGSDDEIVGKLSAYENYADDYFIGKADDAIVIEGPWGTILSILESKWGYLFCIVVVSLLLFLQEVFDLIIEIKFGSTKTTSKTAKTAKAVKTVKTTKTAPVAEIENTTNVASAANTAAKVATKAKNIQTGVKEG